MLLAHSQCLGLNSILLGLGLWVGSLQVLSQQAHYLPALILILLLLLLLFLFLNLMSFPLLPIHLAAQGLRA